MSPSLLAWSEDLASAMMGCRGADDTDSVSVGIAQWPLLELCAPGPLETDIYLEMPAKARLGGGLFLPPKNLSESLVVPLPRRRWWHQL